MRVRFLVPANIRHSSGGNVYNARLAQGLQDLGVEVEVVPVDGSWPLASAKERRRLGSLLGAWSPQAETAHGTVTLVDGLIAVGAPGELEYAAAARQHTWVLLHMLSPGHPDAATHPDAERRALRAASGVICTSSLAAASMKERHGVSGTVAVPGTDTAVVAAGSDPPHIIAVAALLPNKDQLLTVSALARLKDLAWTASLVGADDADPAYAASVRAAISSHGMEERVRVTGELSGPALEAAWHRADLSLLVSRAETFGLVVTESLARGIPVIVRSGTGAVEALALARGGDGANEGATHALPGAAVALAGPEESCAEQLSAALGQWLSQPPLRGAWRDAALEARLRLPGWDSTAQTVFQVLGGSEGVATAAGQDHGQP